VKKLFIIAAVALALAATADASQQAALSHNTKLCANRQTFTTPEFPGEAEVTIRVFAGGHELESVPISDYSIEWSGYGVIVRAWTKPKRAPIRFRMASIRDGCIRVRTLLTWG
jgi:hypothetical protein